MDTIAETAPSLTLSRTIAAPVEDVFDAWTDPEIAAAWWGPEGMSPTLCEIDAREGGAYRITLLGPSGNPVTVGGTYVKIERPRLIVFTWAWENSEMQVSETLVTITIEPSGDRTRLTLLHEKFQTDELRDRHNMGWSSQFDSLEKHFAG